jgi:hypothetical protein
MTKATNTPSEYVILIAFHSNICYAKAPQCDVVRILPVFLEHVKAELLDVTSFSVNTRIMSLTVSVLFAEHDRTRSVYTALGYLYTILEN